MAEPAKKEPETTVGYGARAIVIFYALGIVAIGAKPLIQDYDSILKDLKSTTQSLRREVPKIRESTKPGDKPQSGEVETAKTVSGATNSISSEKTPKGSANSTEGNTAKKKAAMDHLTPSDRQQLNKLLSDL